MYQEFKDKGLIFQENMLAMSLADGQQSTGETLTTQVMVNIEGRLVLTRFVILPKAKGNQTLLETDFVSSGCEKLGTPSIAEMSSYICQLREGQGESSTSVQKEKLNHLFKSYENIFEPGGEATFLFRAAGY
ncbi:hypothetical protein NPIL_430581 [Nephila pilipes]|uniref:Uncharacterized protein n=1 Tax=Nephila pilipes TaxID=299642 RepID=A0A8X6QHV2_NEPPI|nr:hypothetical protein NPIL_430581 [Nephila pilipes]